MIKPEFFDDPSIGELTPLARLFFIGLWTQADREGRLVDDIRRLKVRIFPYDDVEVEALAGELHDKDMIRRYSTGDKHGYIWIRCFAKHQHPHPKEPASVIPPCENGAGKRNGEPCKETASRAESGVRNLDSGVRNRKHGAASPLEGFAAFWDVYPRKKSKGAAEKAWKALRPSPETQTTMLEALGVQVRSPAWRKDGGQFIPYPASWLRAKGWEDEDARPRPVGVDWYEECREMHHGECGLSQDRHHTRKILDAGKRERA